LPQKECGTEGGSKTRNDDGNVILGRYFI